MRTTRDRVRHTLLFELIALVTGTPLGGLIFGVPMIKFGMVAVVTTTIAMIWNYSFNLAFDHAMQRHLKSIRKTLPIRILHALLFEAGLLCLLVPLIAWYLTVSWWQAFLIDTSMAGFYLIYAFAFNWLYDVAVPVAAQDQAA